MALRLQFLKTISSLSCRHHKGRFHSYNNASHSKHNGAREAPSKAAYAVPHTFDSNEPIKVMVEVMVEVVVMVW